MRSFCSLLKLPAYWEFLIVPKTRIIPAAAQLFPVQGRIVDEEKILRNRCIKRACGPVTGVLVGTKCHVLPEVIGALIAQVFTVETDLVIALSYRGLVLGHDAIVG
jgi:hypothetical protein